MEIEGINLKSVARPISSGIYVRFESVCETLIVVSLRLSYCTDGGSYMGHVYCITRRPRVKERYTKNIGSQSPEFVNLNNN